MTVEDITYLILPFFVSLSLVGVHSHANETLTLQAALTEGLGRSPQIERVRAALEESSWRKTKTMGSGFLPKLSASGMHYLSTQYPATLMNMGAGVSNFPGMYPTTNLSIDLHIPVFDGLANIKIFQGATLAAEAAQKELSRAEFQLKKDIELAFYQALAASELDKVAEENVKTMKDHLNQIQIQNRSGVATKYDTLRVEVQLNEARADAIDATDNVELTRRKLIQLIGLENDSRSLEGTLPIPDASKVMNLTITGVPGGRDDIEAQRLRAEAAERMHSANRTWWIPSLELNGQYLIYNQQLFNVTVSDTGNYQGAYNLGLSLRWNIFDGGVAYAKAQESAEQQLQIKKVLETTKLAVPYDFEYWKRRYISNSDHYLSKKLDITRSLESVRLAKEEERAGTRTATETLDAELDLFRARAGAVSAQVNSTEALIHLELVLGKEL